MNRETLRQESKLLIQEIKDCFEGCYKPRGSEIIIKCNQMFESGPIEIRDKIDGKDWWQLDKNFLQKEWAPYPSDIECDGYGDEPAEYALELRGLDWRKIHPDLLSSCYSALSFFTDEGFRYYFPAFILSDLFEYESNADPILHLTNECTVSQRFLQFSTIERQATAEYLRYQAEQDEFSRESIQKALENYWGGL